MKKKKGKKNKMPKLVQPDALVALVESVFDSEVFGVSALRYSGDGSALLSVSQLLVCDTY